ncbi:hypothetical protein BKA82DRAFT_4014911 [Pisolithus tinctorius]|nr:hypothetical protein BKA82DRAFT_4014911 [Pisolithus tinctorius]
MDKTYVQQTPPPTTLALECFPLRDKANEMHTSEYILTHRQSPRSFSINGLMTAILNRRYTRRGQFRLKRMSASPSLWVAQTSIYVVAQSRSDRRAPQVRLRIGINLDAPGVSPEMTLEVDGLEQTSQRIPIWGGGSQVQDQSAEDFRLLAFVSLKCQVNIHRTGLKGWFAPTCLRPNPLLRAELVTWTYTYLVPLPRGGKLRVVIQNAHDY